MIRFVDIRGQGTGYRFAFFDTVCDLFCIFGRNQTWEDEADFVESFNLEPADKDWDVNGYKSGGIARFLSLIPEWAKTPMSEDDPL